MYEVYCNSHPFNLKDTEDLEKIVEKSMNQFPMALNDQKRNIITQMLIKDREKRATID